MLTGILTTRSNFQIGTGELESPEDKQDPSFNSLCLDASERQNPYIPASSVRGYLRSIIEKQESEAVSNTLFGMGRQKSEAKDSGNIGLIRIYDALWDNNQADYSLKKISQTSIDPISNTAKQHQLLSHAIVPPESCFKLTIELDNVTQQQLSLLLKALNTLEKEYGGKLGKAKTSGQGEISWQLNKLDILSQQNFLEWLDFKHHQPLTEFYQNYLEIPEIKALVEDSANIYINDSTKQTTLYLNATSPILINDAEACKAEIKRREEKNKQIESENKEQQGLLFIPDLLFMQNKDSAIIPGSTIKGWVRARCRRILLTLINNEEQKPETNPDEILNQLFGSTEQQGLIEFNTATAQFTQNDIHQQTFTAIDRFTGGAKDGALYQVEAIWPQQAQFELTIRYQKIKEGWMKLLLLFVMRDAMEGGLQLGWGKSKGYGRLVVSTNDHNNWQTFYKEHCDELRLEQETLKQWQDDLQKQLGIIKQEEKAS